MEELIHEEEAPRRKQEAKNWMANPALSESRGRHTGHIKSSSEVKMPICSGNLLEFQEWSNMFKALIHANNRSPAEKMGLLKASMNELCKKLIMGFVNSEAHYHAAFHTLNKVFGDDRLLVESHQREFEALPRVKAKDMESLSDFAFAVQGHVLVIQDRVPKSDVIWGQLERTLERKLDHDFFSFGKPEQRHQETRTESMCFVIGSRR